jgi:hypothetical protein
MLSSERAVFTVKKSYGNSGLPEHAMSLVVPYFPRPPDFRGHYSEKCGTGPELLNDARREQVRPDIARLRRPKAGGDVVWDAAVPAGRCPHRGTSGIMKKKSTEKKKDT